MIQDPRIASGNHIAFETKAPTHAQSGFPRDKPRNGIPGTPGFFVNGRMDALDANAWLQLL